MSEPGHESGGEEQPGSFHFVVPPEHEAGVYANVFALWHTGFEFTVDFAVSRPRERADPDDLESPFVVPCRVVARVKLPVGIVFELIRAISARMAVYEAQWGEIRPPTLREPEDRDQV